jgi:hypothetical protein
MTTTYGIQVNGKDVHPGTRVPLHPQPVQRLAAQLQDVLGLVDEQIPRVLIPVVTVSPPPADPAHGPCALLNESWPVIGAPDGEPPNSLGPVAGQDNMAVAQVQPQQVGIIGPRRRQRYLVGAAWTGDPGGSTPRGTPSASAPIPDRAKRDPNDQGHLTVEYALLAERMRLIHRRLRVHDNIVHRTTDIFGYGPLAGEKGAGSGTRTRMLSRADAFETSV